MKTGPKTRSFPRTARLLRSDDYGWVFANPQRSRDALFTVLARRRSGAPPRLGLAISRKAARRAVDRNRIKRLVREGFRHRRQALGGLDIVVIARPGVADYENGVLRSSLDSHWSRLTNMQTRTRGRSLQS